MRKKSREMDAAWALEVMDKAPYITVSMTDADGMPYSVPLSLARTCGNTFYFHCATEGKKLDILHASPHVCLTAVGRSMSRTVVVRITLTEPPVGKRKQYDANGDELKYGRM